MSSNSAEVDLRDLQEHAARFVRRAAAGDEVIITITGHPAARLIPATAPNHWRTFEELAEIFTESPAFDHETEIGDQLHRTSSTTNRRPTGIGRAAAGSVISRRGLLLRRGAPWGPS
ncbi:type II toxin-antitoxin system Phd/YefM family antitoxin [Saccharopolyspora ipomoeae]|uniref:type II toxin-antitoxin system Phd/YefM family antitoxin n=1 Tax=Saccharopolyspora ipomoeae TaxID=3042027 RepID=UPI003CCFC3ED